VFAATTGLIAATLALGGGGFGAHVTSKPIQFSFSQSAVPKGFHFPTASAGHASVVYCQWADGKTSTTVAAAKRITCFPRGSHFPDLTGSRWALLESPIGGEKYPTLGGSLSDDIRLVRASDVRGVMAVSPVLMQFGDYSGGARPSIIVSGNSVWLYDYRTEHGAELLRVSTSNGTVIQRTAMPAISRPACAVNRYGFWMAQAPNSFFSEKARMGVWYAPTGAKHGVLVQASDDNVIAIGTVGSTVDVLAEKPAHGVTAAPEYLWQFTPSPGSGVLSGAVAARRSRSPHRKSWPVST
jgi:hypothetical protein